MKLWRLVVVASVAVLARKSVAGDVTPSLQGLADRGLVTVRVLDETTGEIVRGATVLLYEELAPDVTHSSWQTIRSSTASTLAGS